MAVKDVILPMLGETMNDGVIVEWMKAMGEPVKRGEVLFAVETDKAILEVEASAEGFLREKLKMRFAKELGFNISYNDLLMVIVAKALRCFPAVNARLDEAAGVIHQLDEINISLAMDTRRGLIVLVIRDVDRNGLLDIARITNDLVTRTRAGKVLPDEFICDANFQLSWRLTSLVFSVFTQSPTVTLCAIASNSASIRGSVRWGERCKSSNSIPL